MGSKYGSCLPTSHNSNGLRIRNDSFQKNLFYSYWYIPNCIQKSTRNWNPQHNLHKNDCILHTILVSHCNSSDIHRRKYLMVITRHRYSLEMCYKYLCNDCCRHLCSFRTMGGTPCTSLYLYLNCSTSVPHIGMNSLWKIYMAKCSRIQRNYIGHFVCNHYTTDGILRNCLRY